jgi:hypothetical protein
VRLALITCAAALAGKPAAGSTQRRKRSVFYNALIYAVELGRLDSNPVDRIQWTAPAVAQSVDRRVVVSPAQGRAQPLAGDADRRAPPRGQRQGLRPAGSGSGSPACAARHSLLGVTEGAGERWRPAAGSECNVTTRVEWRVEPKVPATRSAAVCSVRIDQDLALFG